MALILNMLVCTKPTQRNELLRSFFILLSLLCVVFVSPLRANEVVSLKSIEVPNLPDPIAKNIRMYLNPLLNKGIEQINADYVISQAELALSVFGYYEPDVQLQWANEGTALIVQVSPNKQLHWSKVSITLSGAGKQDPLLNKLLESLPLKQGEAVSHQTFDASKKQIEDALLEMGFFDFRWVKSQLRVSKKEAKASAVLHVETGERYQFGQVIVSKSTQAETFVLSLAPFSIGQPYLSAKLSQYSLALNQTPYFTSVRVYPLLNNRKNGKIDVQVEVVDKPANSYEIGGGFSTDLGAKIRFKWSKPWISDDGHYVDTNLSVSQKQRDVTASYTIPVDDPVADVWRINTGYKLEDELVEDNFSEVLTVQLQRQWLTSSNWVRTAFVRREKENYRLEGVSRTTHMTIPGISWAKKQKRGGTLPTWGEERLVAIEGASQKLASSSNMFRVQWKNAWLRSYERHYLYSRIDLGAIISPDITDIPYSLRFYAGGDQSIRGFDYQTISPTEDDVKTGGRYMVTGAMEYQYQFAEKWRAALFVDAGTATNDFSEEVSVGAGFGVRYLTPIGPVRFDLAWPLNSDRSSPRISIVLGPEI